MSWQKNSGYDRCALAEAAIGRYKQVIGDVLRSRTHRRQVTEAAIAVNALNRMLEFGRPRSVRIEWNLIGAGINTSIPLIPATSRLITGQGR